MRIYFLSFLLFLSFIIVDDLFSQESLLLDSTVNESSLSNYSYHYNDLSNSKEACDLVASDWERMSPPLTFPNNKSIQWIKYSMVNPYNKDISKYLYIPYHFIHEIDVYTKTDTIIELLAKTGTKRDFANKDVYSRGYPIRITFKANTNTQILIKYTHIYRPLRAAAFLMSDDYMVQVIRRSEQIIWFWRGLFIFALIVAFALFLFLKLKVYLYYFILNLGVGIFIASHIGDYFLFFDADKTDLTGFADYTGAILMNFFLPLFLNELTPIKKRNPIAWKASYGIISIMIFFWVMSVFPFWRMSIFNYYSHFVIMLGSFVVLGLQPFLLAKAIYYKDRNAIPVFFIYSLYVTSAFLDVILPNMGILKDTPFVYDNLLLSSFIEIFTFMFIMARESVTVYVEREKLMLDQQQHQKQIIQSIVKSQEDERNNIGRELHDSLGANMAIIKQSIKKTDKGLYSVVLQSIEMVRNLSHNLVTPNIKSSEFKSELKELCHLFSAKNMKVQNYFFEWPNIVDTSITTNLYRITQELLKNAAMHSRATDVHLQFIGDNEKKLNIIYEDNGIGFNQKEINNNGLGLRNIQNRLELINGKINIDTSEDSNGTTIIIEIEQ